MKNQLTELRTTLRRRFVPRRHTALLVAIVTAFAARPLIGDIGMGPLIFSIALLVLLLVALYTIQVDELVGERETLLTERRRRSILGWTLAGLAFAGRVAMIFFPWPRLYIAGLVCWLVFFSFVTWTELRSVLKQKHVTSETISMAISVYLLFGLTWGVLYIVIFQLQPHAFNLGSSLDPTLLLSKHEQEVFPIFIYFSLTTLATIGYGDITPVTLQARYAAVAEGIIGQFYLAILVARLVAMHMNQPADKDTRDQSRP